MGKMQHILSLSYGKDSMACLGAIEKLGRPLDRIVHSEVWATDTIPADLPPMMEFKNYADAVIKERWGIVVEHFSATNIDGVTGDKVTYQDGFYHVLKRGKYCGKIKGFPLQKGPWCQKLKLNSYDTVSKTDEGFITYLGISADETKRFGDLNETTKSPIKELGWTESDCRNWCERNGLLSPVYTEAERSGCWFCHNQGVYQLRLLRKNYSGQAKGANLRRNYGGTDQGAAEAVAGPGLKKSGETTMCCCRINTDVLLANLFSKFPGNLMVSLADLQVYLAYLSERFPTYVVSDCSLKAMRECVEAYPELYRAVERDGSFLIARGALSPKASYFNSQYPASIARYIGSLTDGFFEKAQESPWFWKRETEV